MSGRGGRGTARGRGRGRGRGGSRGRGSSRGRRGGSAGPRGSRGGRGRGFRGRGRGGYGTSPSWTDAEVDQWGVEKQGKDNSLDIKKDLKKFFVGTASFDQHYDAQEENVLRYVAGMAVLEKNGVEISTNARVRALAAAWARKDHKLADCLLANSESFGLVEVLKAVTLLDSARRIREEEKKLKRLQMENGGKIKPRVMGKLKSNIDNLTALKPKCGSASGAVCKHIRQWVRRFTKDELEFYALHFPTDPWRRLADICHFHPQKDFAELPWFLKFCFGEEAPEGTMVQMCRDMKVENVNDLLKEFPIPYSHLKKCTTNLTEESKGRVAAKDKLDQVIWNYEDLQCSEVDNVIKYRLTKGEVVTLPNGKLMERLLTIKMIREDISTRSRSYYSKEEVTRNKNPTKAMFFDLLLPQAQRHLANIKLTLDSPVVVIGDRSASMEVAIRTSTIIASLLTAICGAKLVFFDHENTDAPFIPTNITEVLEMAVTIQTRGSTAPAASLWPFYTRKELVKTFILVTDEEENGSYEGHRFAPLYKKYLEEVNPDCRLVFVSFLRSQHQTGQMVDQLHSHGVTKNIMQFKFDQTRPDLTKLDKLFGLLSAETEDFETEVRNMEERMAVDGMTTIFSKMKVKDTAGDSDVSSVEVVDSVAGDTSVSVTDSVMAASDIEVINLEDAMDDTDTKTDAQTTGEGSKALGAVMAQSVGDWQVVNNAWGQGDLAEDWS